MKTHITIREVLKKICDTYNLMSTYTRVYKHLYVYKEMKRLKFKDFMQKYILEHDTLNESKLRRIFKYPIYPKDSKINSNRRFVKTEHGRMGGSPWTCFYVKNNESLYFDSFGGQPAKILLNQIPKPVLCHI